MAQLRTSTPSAEDIGSETVGIVESTSTLGPARSPGLRPDEWMNDEDALLGEMLLSHGLGDKLVARLLVLATAPTHVRRSVDRLAIALGAQFNFFGLEEAWQQPILLCGLPNAGTSTLAAKLAARFDDSEVIVISTGMKDASKTALLAENLEALDLPLTHAPDAGALARAVAAAAGRKIIVDAAGQSPLDRASLGNFTKAAGAAGMLVISADTPPAEATAAAKAASAAGIARLLVTRLDTARYLGATLAAADATKLALVAASVTPHFGFGLRALTPENLARRLMSAAHPERWRAAPL
jgi:signal recognition particle GTPase